MAPTIWINVTTEDGELMQRVQIDAMSLLPTVTDGAIVRNAQAEVVGAAEDAARAVFMRWNESATTREP